MSANSGHTPMMACGCSPLGPCTSKRRALGKVNSEGGHGHSGMLCTLFCAQPPCWQGVQIVVAHPDMHPSAW